MEDDARRYVPPGLMANCIAPLMEVSGPLFEFVHGPANGETKRGSTFELVDLDAERLELAVWLRIEEGARRVAIFGVALEDIYSSSRKIRLQVEAGAEGWRLRRFWRKTLEWERGGEILEVRLNVVSEPFFGIDADAIFYAIRREGTQPPPREEIALWKPLDDTGRRKISKYWLSLSGNLQPENAGTIGP